MVTAALVACGAAEEMELTSRIDLDATLELRAPPEGATGRCGEPFQSRFCRDQYVSLGTAVLGANQSRTLTLTDAEGGECNFLLWLRVINLESVGPVADLGTVFELPTEAELEPGAGAVHTVAFPQATIRLDQVGPTDDRQSGPPPACP